MWIKTHRKVNFCKIKNAQSGKHVAKVKRVHFAEDITCSREYQANRRVAEIQIFEKTYLIVIKDETGLKFKINDYTLFLIGSYAQKLVASY